MYEWKNAAIIANSYKFLNRLKFLFSTLKFYKRFLNKSFSVIENFSRTYTGTIAKNGDRNQAKQLRSNGRDILVAERARSLYVLFRNPTAISQYR